MKIITALLIVMTCAALAYSHQTEELDERITQYEERISKLEKKLARVSKHDAGDNVKLGADFRSSFDHIAYDTALGESSNNDVWSARLILTLGSSPIEKLALKGALAANKLFGTTNIGSIGMNNSDWIATVTPDDSTLRVRELYMYFTKEILTIPYTFSIGRRPSLNGLGMHLREDDEPGSPLSHTVNLEFDAISLKAALEDKIDIPGTYVKLCAGRGASNASEKYSFTSNKPYDTNAQEPPSTDLYGIIFEPYNDGQYRVTTQISKALNVGGLRDLTDPGRGFQSVGHIYLASAYFGMDGLGDGSSDFLFDTNVFLSFALSRTDPDRCVRTTVPNPTTGDAEAQVTGMLGSTDTLTGYSIFAGVEFPIPSFFESGAKLGLQYNYGSQNWRSMTYGEDTLVGSKLAARGQAYEIYLIQPLIKNYLTLAINATYIDYEYTGSNAFFGEESKPLSINEAVAAGMNPVENATDIRIYLRYRY